MTRRTLAATLAAATLITSPAFAVETGDMITARQHVFGHENVDPVTGAIPEDKVIFSWLLAASFVARAVGGKVFFIDTFVTRLEVERGRTPLTIMDLANLNADVISVSHGHGDHADNAVFIAAHTGAPIYATEEFCAATAIDFERMAKDPRIQSGDVYAFPDAAGITCLPVTAVDSVPGPRILNLTFLEPHACVTAFRHLHSVAVPPDPDFPPTPVEFAVDERDATLFPPGKDLWPRRAARRGTVSASSISSRRSGRPMCSWEPPRRAI